MLNKIMNVFKGGNKTEFDIELNEEEVLVLKQGVESVADNKLHDITKETNIEKIKELIEIYNEANQLLKSINEEIENKMEEITVNKIQIDIVLEALTIIEGITTNNLKSVENPSSYKILCKTMVTVTNLMERVIELV